MSLCGRGTQPARPPPRTARINICMCVPEVVVVVMPFVIVRRRPSLSCSQQTWEAPRRAPRQQTCNNHGGHRARICCSAPRAAGRPHCARAAPVRQYHSGAPRARYAPHAPPSHASSTTSYCAIAGHAAKLLTSACCATAPARPPVLSARAARAATPLRSSAHDPRTALPLVPCTKHIMLFC